MVFFIVQNTHWLDLLTAAIILSFIHFSDVFLVNNRKYDANFKNTFSHFIYLKPNG